MSEREELTSPAATIDRIKSGSSVIKSLRSGKPDASTTAVVQEVISVLQNLNQTSEVVVTGLKFMHDALAAAPHTSTLIRLEGGIKIFFKILRTNSSDSQVTALAASVLCRCCNASNVTLLTLVKEKNLGSVLISTMSSHANNASVMGPLCDLLALLTNHPRGASQLADDGMVALCKELLVNFLGNWAIFGMVLKLVKNMAKHEGPCAALARNPNMGKLLLGVARLLARLPDQHKLLKRTSRALWLLHRSSLVPLPPMEPSMPIYQSSPHLNMLSAMDADVTRHMELFPEEFAQPPPSLPQQQQLQQLQPQGLGGVFDEAERGCVPQIPLLPHLQTALTAHTQSRAPSSASSDVLPDITNVRQPLLDTNCPPTAETGDATDGVSVMGGAGDGGAVGGTVSQGGWKGCVRTVRPMRVPVGPPPSAAFQTAAACALSAEAGPGGVPPEPFHNWGGNGSLGLDMMMHDLRRLIQPEVVLNRRVYSNVPERQSSSRQRAEDSKQGQPAAAPAPVPKARAARAATAAATVPDSTQFGDQLLAKAVRRGHLLCPLSPMALGPSSNNSGSGPGRRSGTSVGSQGALSSIGKGRLIPRGGGQRRPGPDAFKGTSAAVHCQWGAPMGDNPNAVDGSSSGLCQGPWVGAGPDAATIGGGAAAQVPLPPLQFESNFESGNLRAAVQVYENEYDLFLSSDLNDRSEGGNLCQWFFFALTGVQPGVPYKFNLVNFRKKQSLFSSGMQPLVCCSRHATVGPTASSICMHSTNLAGNSATTSSTCTNAVHGSGASVDPSMQQYTGAEEPSNHLSRHHTDNTLHSLGLVPSCSHTSSSHLLAPLTEQVNHGANCGSSDSQTHSAKDAGAQGGSGANSFTREGVRATTSSDGANPHASGAGPAYMPREAAMSRNSSLSNETVLSSTCVVGDGSSRGSHLGRAQLPLRRSTGGASEAPLKPSRSAIPVAFSRPLVHRSSKDLQPQPPPPQQQQQQQQLASRSSRELLPQQQQQGQGPGSLQGPGTASVPHHPEQPQKQHQQHQGVWDTSNQGAGCVQGTWVRMGSHVAYYPSPYRGRPSTSPLSDPPKRGIKKVSSTNTSKNCGTRSSATAGSAAAPTTNSTSSASQPNSASGNSSSTTGGSAKGGRGGDAPVGPVFGDVGPGLYCCTFTLQFPEPDATYYIAPCYPYTYSDLQEHLDRLAVRLAPPPAPPASQALPLLPLHHQPDQMPQVLHAQLQQQQPQPPSRPAAEACAMPLRPRTPSLPLGSLQDHTLPAAIGGVLMRSLLCYTLAGHRVDCLTITDFRAPLEVVRQREAIMLTARVHPGESNASWIMQGALDFLTSDAPAAHTLRRSFVFKIVPMLNPDGVINGSYRCSLAGVDLNRMWEHPVKYQHPSVYHSKKLLAQLAGTCRLALYVDIHGHSTKEDAFFYGCEPNVTGLDKTPPAPPPASAGLGVALGPLGTAARPNTRPGGSAFEVDAPMPGGYVSSGCDGLNWGAPGSLAAMPLMAPSPLAISGTSHWQLHSQQQQQQQLEAQAAGAPLQPGQPAAGGGQPPSARQAARLRVRMLPYLVSCISSDYSLPKCGFRIRKAKLGAARVVANRELGCAGAYTLEASLGGRAQGRSHFSDADYIGLGENLCRGIAALAEVDDAALLEDMSRNITLPSFVSTYTS